MKSPNLRALIVEPVGGHGGMNYYDIGLCSGLANAGIDVTLYTCDINPPSELGGLFRVKPAFRGVFGSDPVWLRGLRYIRTLVLALIGGRFRRNKVAHFHFFHVGPVEFCSVVLARLLLYRVVVTAHDVESFMADLSVQGLIRRTYALVHAVVAHNVTSSQEVVKKLGVAPERIHIIPHGSYVDFVERLPARCDANRSIGLLDTEGPVILFFGQIKEVKGLDLLLKAFGEVIGEFPAAKLVIAGRVWKDDFSSYQRLIEEMDISQHVALHVRYIADSEVSNFYAAADLIVLPYKRIYQSGVLLMAMSYGVPVLTSDLAAMREVVVDGENGFLFPNGDVPGLALALSRALGDKQCRQRASENALASMHERFSWRAIGVDTAAVYNSI